MTYLLIGKNFQLQENYLKEFLSKVFGYEINQIQDTPDIHILDKRAENSIGIEDVKDFVKEMIYKPFDGKKQVAIVYASEKLTNQAQNSLLKTLEESSDDTIYMLCVNNEKNVLPTIYSRSKPIYLRQEGESIKEEIIKPEILDKDLVEQFEYVNEISEEKNDCLDFLNTIEAYYKGELEKEIKNVNINSSRTISERLKYIQETREKINSNCNKKLVLEALFVYLNA